jgi:IS30 family transposase
MAYTHLTAEERYHIYELKHEQMSVTDIAAELGRSKSTISRELSRNAGHCGYRPNQAQTKSDLRLHVARGGQRVAENTWQACKKLLRLGCSPEQAAGRCAIDGDGKLSHEWIYQRIYEDKRSGGNLWQTLRCQKKRRKRYGSGRTRRGLIPGRVGIEQRCPRVEARATVGHWEADTVIGRNHKHALVTLVERKTGFGIVRWVTSKDSQTVAEAII